MLAVLVWSLVFTNLGRGARRLPDQHELDASVPANRPCWAWWSNVALNLVLIPRWGGMGAVVGVVRGVLGATHGSCFVYPPLFRTAAGC